MNNRPVIIVDDDTEEHEILQEIWQEMGLKNPLLFFGTAEGVLDHLQKDPTNPFIIICDVNLPQMDGFTLRQRFADEPALHYKSIPFVFWSTAASNDQIKRAYDCGVHGFFLKGANYTQIKESLNIILNYWNNSKSPIVT